MPRQAGRPYIPISDAIKRLGEDGEAELVYAHVAGKVQLVGRHRQPGGSTSDEFDPIPAKAFAEYWSEPTSANGAYEAAGAVQINLNSNSIEANGATEDFAQFERLAHCGWEQVKVAAAEIDALVIASNGRFEASTIPQQHLNRPETACNQVRNGCLPVAAQQRKIDIDSNSATSKKRGRPKGSGSYEKKDAEVVLQMNQLIEKGECSSPSNAALKLIGLIEGGGKDEARIKRAVSQYKKTFPQ